MSEALDFPYPGERIWALATDLSYSAHKVLDAVTVHRDTAATSDLIGMEVSWFSLDVERSVGTRLAIHFLSVRSRSGDQDHVKSCGFVADAGAAPWVDLVLQGSATVGVPAQN